MHHKKHNCRNLTDKRRISIQSDNNQSTIDMLVNMIYERTGMNKSTLCIFLLLLIHIHCITDFENLEICSSYRTYPLEGNYGPKGVPSTEYYPSSRYFTQSSYNKEQNILWVFGGVEDYEDGDEIMFNDLWKYNLSSNEWTWVSGSSIPDQKSVYYEKGKPHADNVPGARYGGCFWEDSNGALWLFGGLGFSVTENKG